MPRVDRYFLESSAASGKAQLSGDEAHHLVHVMRAKPGTQVVLFDGAGREYLASVNRVERNEVWLDLILEREVDRELSTEVILGVTLPKGERQKWLVEKAVELGVSKIVPLETERSVARPTEQAMGRLRRGVIEASKQCGRNRLLVIAEPAPWPAFVAESQSYPRRFLAHPLSCQENTGVPPMVLSHGDDRGIGPVALAVGPEGGFTAAEVALAVSAGWQPTDLGPRILRIETAALVMVALATRWIDVQ